jgi:hypothetical protein
MIRFIKNILDVKNILGMQRALPTYPANELILRAATYGGIVFVPTYNGDLTVQVAGNTYTYSNSYSGSHIGVTGVTANTDVRLTGDIHAIGTDTADINFLAISNGVQGLEIDSGIKVIDLRNANDIRYNQFFWSGDDVDTLYAIANNNNQGRVSKAIIQHSTVADGTLWINAAQAYAQDVIAAAKSKGWRIRYKW